MCMYLIQSISPISAKLIVDKANQFNKQNPFKNVPASDLLHIFSYILVYLTEIKKLQK